MRRSLVAAGLVIAGVAAVLLSSGGGRRGVPPGVGQPALSAPAGEQFGVSVNRLFNDRSFTRAQIDAQLAAARNTGISVARSDALWELAEPRPPVAGVHRYAWGFDDSIVAALATHGITWMPILDYSASWAAEQPATLHAPPRSRAGYAAFAAALARRYGNAGSFWRAHPELPRTPVRTYEVWNEPDNLLFWPPAPDPRVYAELYARTRAAINAVDASARVIIGGLTAPGVFMPALLRSLPALRGHIDGVGIHPYAGQPAGVLDSVRLARVTLDSLGMATVPLYVTEFGWTTKPRGALSWLPESLRPGYIRTTVGALGQRDCGLAAVLLYTWVTPERDRRNREDWFGIHPPGGGESRDSVAFKDGVRVAEASAPRAGLCRSAG